MKNRYFHELTQIEINKLLEEKVDLNFIMCNYKQPNWCNYLNALGGEMGCWTLMNLRPNGGRTKISEEFCSDCDNYENKL